MNEQKWIDRIVELQSLAQAGLTYGRDRYDLERYERIRTLSAEMLADAADLPLETVQGLFCNETGYQMPKVDTRAAVFSEGKILLVRENDGRWALPGGWCDVNQSVGENTAKEVFEEAGLTVQPQRIIAVQDRNRHNPPRYACGVVKIFMLCALVGGQFQENFETTESRYFAREEIPDALAQEKVTREQIELCFDAQTDERWIPVFD